jgi:hypothetical protein
MAAAGAVWQAMLHCSFIAVICVTGHAQAATAKRVPASSHITQTEQLLLPYYDNHTLPHLVTF